MSSFVFIFFRDGEKGLRWSLFRVSETALAYAPIFFNLDVNAEDVGEVISEGML